MSNPYELSDDMPVYVISVAAQLSDMHPQTLRAYEKLGLVSPGRRSGQGSSQSKGHRRYSMRDILALRMKRKDWDDVLSTNLTGAFLLTQAVNISSQDGAPILHCRMGHHRAYSL